MIFFNMIDNRSRDVECFYALEVQCWANFVMELTRLGCSMVKKTRQNSIVV